MYMYVYIYIYIYIHLYIYKSARGLGPRALLLRRGELSPGTRGGRRVPELPDRGLSTMSNFFVRRRIAAGITGSRSSRAALRTGGFRPSLVRAGSGRAPRFPDSYFANQALLNGPCTTIHMTMTVTTVWSGLAWPGPVQYQSSARFSALLYARRLSSFTFLCASWRARRSALLRAWAARLVLIFVLFRVTCDCFFVIYIYIYIHYGCPLFLFVYYCFTYFWFLFAEGLGSAASDRRLMRRMFWKSLHGGKANGGNRNP